MAEDDARDVPASGLAPIVCDRMYTGEDIEETCPTTDDTCKRVDNSTEVALFVQGLEDKVRAQFEPNIERIENNITEPRTLIDSLPGQSDEPLLRIRTTLDKQKDEVEHFSSCWRMFAHMCNLHLQQSWLTQLEMLSRQSRFHIHSG